MKITIDTKKGAEAVTGFLQKTSDAGKKALADVQAGAAALSEKNKQESYLRRMKKYNPVFPNVYHSEEFVIPKMIVIRDDVDRREIDVCEGSIGWLGKESELEVLYLYDKDASESGIQFVPSATCDSVYFVDNFDSKRFIRTDCIFSKAHEERLAELKYVAHSLGAKCCTIEITESSTEIAVAKKKAAIGAGARIHGVKATSAESAEQNASQKSSTQRSGKVTAEFEGSDKPKRPKLKWFANDDNIKRLIDMRCKGSNGIKSETLELAGTSSATMSQKTACAIDNAIGAMKMKGSSTMESQVIKENHSKLIFHIEF